MNILVTAIGSMSADCVISSLNRLGYSVLGCDIFPSEWHAVSRDCKKVYRAPLPNIENSYINFLIEIATSNNIKYIIPLTDPEIDTLNRNRDKFNQEGIVLCMPSEDAVLTARNKYKLFERFNGDKNVPSARTYNNKAEDINFAALPYIAKPNNGRSSEGFLKLSTEEEVRNVLSREGYIIQEFISGPVFAVDYVRNDTTNSDFAMPREELLRTKNGAGTTVCVQKNLKLQNLASYIGRSFKINGCINMEFIKSNEDFYLIDVNPRFSAGVAFSYIAGYDMVESHMNCFLDRDILPPVEFKEQIIVKRYKEEVVSITRCPI